MIKKLGIELYTLRDFMKDEKMLDFTLGRLKEIGYEEGQTAGWAVPIEKFAPIAKKHGMTIVGTHNQFDDLVANTEKIAEAHKLLGTTNVGTGCLPTWAMENLDSLKKFCDEANKVADILSGYGYKFTYHHHSFEFAKVDGNKRMIDVLIENLNPATTSFVLDTYWVQHGGGDVCAWIEKLAGRIEILHLKDMERGKDGAQITSIGNGNLNWKKIIETAGKCKIKYYVVEQDNNWVDNNPFTAVENSAKYIKANLM